MNYWWMLAAAAPALLAGAWLIRFATNDYSRKGDLAIIPAVASIFVGVVFGAVFLALTLERHACLEKGERLGKETTYRALSGCFVETYGNDMVPLDNWYENTGN